VALVLALRAGLVAVLVAAGWLVYRTLPPPSATNIGEGNSSVATTVQIVLRGDQRGTSVLDVPIEISPIDIVAVRNEFFVERRAGERFDDFRNQRMKGRNSIKARLDSRGQTTVKVPAGNWWIYAMLPGEEELEWRLKVSIAGPTQIVELTPQNAYARTKSF
jgi:hypothetical protein